MKIQALIYEKRGHWGAALRARIAARAPRPVSVPALRLVEARSLAEIHELDLASFSVAVFEMNSANATRVLDTLVELDRTHPALRLVVVGQLEILAWESASRLAGAGLVIDSLLAVDAVLDLIARVPAPKETPKSPLETIWNRLPWDRHAKRMAADLRTT